MRIFAVQKLQERYLKVLIINIVSSVQQSRNAYGGAVKIIVIIFFGTCLAICGSLHRRMKYPADIE